MKIFGILTLLSFTAVYSSSHLRNWPDNENIHALSSGQASGGSVEYLRNPEDFYEGIQRTNVQRNIYENWLLQNRSSSQQNVNEQHLLRSDIPVPRSVVFENPQKIPSTQFIPNERGLQHRAFYPELRNVETVLGNAGRESASIPLGHNEALNHEAVAASVSKSLYQNNPLLSAEIPEKNYHDIQNQGVVANSNFPNRRNFEVYRKPEISPSNVERNEEATKRIVHPNYRNLNAAENQSVQRVLSNLQPQKKFLVIYPNGKIDHVDDVEEIVKNYPKHVFVNSNQNINTASLSKTKQINFHVDPATIDKEYHNSESNNLQHELTKQTSQIESSTNAQNNNLKNNYNVNNKVQSNKNQFHNKELPNQIPDNESQHNDVNTEKEKQTKIKIEIERKLEPQLPMHKAFSEIDKNVTNSYKSSETFSSERHTSENNETSEILAVDKKFDDMHSNFNSSVSTNRAEETTVSDNDSNLDDTESKQIDNDDSSSNNSLTEDAKLDTKDIENTSSGEEKISKEEASTENPNCTSLPYPMLDANDSTQKENEESGKVTYQDGDEWKQVSLEGKVFDILHSFDVPLVPLTISDAEGIAHSCLKMAYSTSRLAYIICSNRAISN